MMSSSATPPPVRPERFAWSDEEAIVIFGGGWIKMLKQRQAGASQDIAKQPRILVAGRYDDRINDVPAAIEAARDVPRDRFVILERAGQYYMQCLCRDYGWLLEKREGDEQHHYRAIVSSTKPQDRSADNDLMSRIFSKRAEPSPYLDIKQVLDAMNSYHQGNPEPDWLSWERIEV